MSIVANQWYAITFLPFSDPVWTGLTAPYPFLHEAVVEAVVQGTPLLLYCMFIASVPYFVAAGGNQYPISEDIMDVVTALPMEITTIGGGEVWYSIRDSGAWVWYSTTGGVRSVAAPSSLAAFLT